MNTSFNLTMHDITKILLVTGTEENYKSPMKFDGAWNDPDREMRDNWKNAIKKEFQNMEKKITYGSYVI